MFSRTDTVRDTQQLRDIEELIARLDDVNQKLSLPVRTMPVAPEPADA